jgi:hypothetical protein
VANLANAIPVEGLGKCTADLQRTFQVDIDHRQLTEQANPSGPPISTRAKYSELGELCTTMPENLRGLRKFSRRS